MEISEIRRNCNFVRCGGFFVCKCLYGALSRGIYCKRNDIHSGIGRVHFFMYIPGAGVSFSNKENRTIVEEFS